MPMVDVNLISALERIRSLSEPQVAALADSIAEVGLLNPVTVYRKQIVRNGQSVDGYGLVSGRHRLEACKRLGHVEIEATVVDLDELQRVIAECDENLCGTHLTPAERAELTHRRKWAYEALHPETVKGAAQAHGMNRALGNVSANFAPTFSEDASKRNRQSRRKVELEAERGVKISNSAIALLKGTHLDTGKYLDQLKTLASDEQISRVKADLARRPEPRRDAVATARAAKIDADVKGRAARAVANFIAERANPDEWDGLKADLYAAGATNIADELSNITGHSHAYGGHD